MKKLLFILLAGVSINTAAQQKQVLIKDSLPAKVLLKNRGYNSKAVIKLSVAASIENELNKIVAAHVHLPNTAATWTKIKLEADNLLYNYFRDEKLFGIKKEQAYYIAMGNETMTAADIANKKMILLAGIANIKPAEFLQIRVEKINTYY
ncbi:hypothetical protein [Ferruginibacter sp.]